MKLYVKFIKISASDYNAILDQLRAYTVGTAASDATDPDQPPKPADPPLPDWLSDAESADDDDLLPL